MEILHSAQEAAYRRLHKQGLSSWNASANLPDVEPGVERFLLDVLEQSWIPKTGTALELGCGTGPLSRWLSDREWQVTGIDTSPTAIAMAQEQSEGSSIHFIEGDVTQLSCIDDQSIDLSLDGQCLHCLVSETDRIRFLQENARVVREGGCLVLMTMARPVLGKLFRQKYGLLKNNRVYHPAPDDCNPVDTVIIEGKRWFPTRYLEHWQTLLKQLKEFGFEPRLIRLSRCHPEDPLSYLSCAAIRCSGAASARS
ncbi:MAG: class I SAM-dependent methyltransferase [Sedimenticola sp.]